MKNGGREHKRTVGYGKTKVTTFIPEDHPVFRGVMEAREVLGGQFPEHVGRIRICPDTVSESENGLLVLGDCVPCDRGGSVIHIYAGSIEVASGLWPTQTEARRTTLHEIGHSGREAENQAGGWLGPQPGREWMENDANRFARETYSAYRTKETPKHRVHTWRQLAELRKGKG